MLLASITMLLTTSCTHVEGVKYRAILFRNDVIKTMLVKSETNIVSFRNCISENWCTQYFYTADCYTYWAFEYINNHMQIGLLFLSSLSTSEVDSPDGGLTLMHWKVWYGKWAKNWESRRPSLVNIAFLQCLKRYKSKSAK